MTIESVLSYELFYRRPPQARKMRPIPIYLTVGTSRETQLLSPPNGNIGGKEGN